MAAGIEPSEYRVGDKLRHTSGGSLWEVLEHIGGSADTYRCKCIEEGRGSELGRVDHFHHEYMVRSFLIEAGPDRRRVVVKTIDLDTDEVLAESRMGPESDYVIVTGPGFHVAHEQFYSRSGTTQLTIKRRAAEQGRSEAQ